MFHCEGPRCMRVAGNRRKFRDPRRDSDDQGAYVEKYFCSDECEEDIVNELERQARLARLVH